MIFLGFINAYYFSLIRRVCSITGALSYYKAWKLSVGKSGLFIVALSCSIGYVALGALSYSLIIVDSTLSIIATTSF